MGSSRHRDRSRDRGKDKDRDRDRRERKRGSRDRAGERSDRGDGRGHRGDREGRRGDRDRDRAERERRSRSRSTGGGGGGGGGGAPAPAPAVEKFAKEKTPPEPDGEKLLAETLATLANIAATRQYTAPTFTTTIHKIEGDFGASLIKENVIKEESSSQKKRKSRWGGSEHDKIFIPGMPTILPQNLNKEQEQAYLLQLQIEEVSRKLRSGDLGIPANPEERSPSPEPIYSSDGKRLNTREFRTRRKLEEDRHALVLKMQSINPDFKPPVDYKPPVIRVSDKVMIPQEEHPEINFVGLLIGPRGNTLKTMEKETGAKIIIRGKGSVKEGKVGRKDGQPLPGEDEPLHAYITATNPECVKKAVERIKEVIRQGVEVPENQNDLRRMQLRELAQLNGTLRENDGLRCNNCGATDHKSWLCPDKPNVTNNIVCSSCGAAGHIARDCRQKRPGLGGPAMIGDKAKIDEEYMSLMAELGEGPPPEFLKSGNGGGGQPNRGKGTINMFDPQVAPRPLMPPPMANPAAAAAMMPNGMAMPPPPWAGGVPWQPGPPGIMPPPPPPGASSPPQMMAPPWLAAANGQPPPPGAGAALPPPGVPALPPWQPAAAPFQWPPANCTPPPPPGIDMSSLLSAPPPPPPSST